MSVREMVLTYRSRASPVGIDGRRSFGKPSEAAPVLDALLSDQVVEVFGILCLTTKHRFQGYYEVSRGSLDTTPVHPRDVFKAAIMANAAAVILAHNHPSGDPLPSADDRTLTRRLVEVGTLIGVDVLDHIIIGHEGRYFSFKETGGL